MKKIQISSVLAMFGKAMPHSQVGSTMVIDGYRADEIIYGNNIKKKEAKKCQNSNH